MGGAATVDTEAAVLKSYYAPKHGHMVKAMKEKGMLGRKKKKPANEKPVERRLPIPPSVEGY